MTNAETYIVCSKRITPLCGNR